MKIVDRIKKVLNKREDEERRHRETLEAIHENRKSIQSLESTVRLAVRKISCEDMGQNADHEHS